MPTYDNIRDFKHPIFLILRTALADILAYELFDQTYKKTDNMEKANEEVKLYLGDQFVFFAREAKRREQTDRVEEIESILPDFPFRDKTDNSYKMNPSVIYKNLDKSDFIEKVYNAYNYLSKFEHIGPLTFLMEQNGALFIENDLVGIHNAIGMVLQVVDSTFEFFNGNR